MKKLLQFLFTILLLIAAIYIVFYYWTAKDVDELTELPSSLLSAVVAYIAIQLLKRFIKKKIEWFDWFYYVGLIAVLLPLLMLGISPDWLFELTRYGSLFFIVPPVFELLSIVMKSKD